MNTLGQLMSTMQQGPQAPDQNGMQKPLTLEDYMRMLQSNQANIPRYGQQGQGGMNGLGMALSSGLGIGGAAGGAAGFAGL